MTKHICPPQYLLDLESKFRQPSLCDARQAPQLNTPIVAIYIKCFKMYSMAALHEAIHRQYS